MDNKQDKQSVVLGIFEQGKRFTEDLLKENERLRMSVAQLKSELRDVEGEYIKADVPMMRRKIGVLEEEVRKLREENQELRDQFTYVEDENREFAERYIEVEKQNSDLINLYVASYRLHSTINYAEVVSTIKEVVVNMIGAEEFGVYLLGEDPDTLQLAAHEGLVHPVEAIVPFGEGLIGKAAAAGEVYVAPLAADQKRDEAGQPIACIPLKIEGEVLGAIAIYSLLLQKEGFQSLDFELFELLGNHAAAAIYGAKLYSLSNTRRVSLRGFLDLVRKDLDARSGESIES